MVSAVCFEQSVSSSDSEAGTTGWTESARSWGRDTYALTLNGAGRFCFVNVDCWQKCLTDHLAWRS